MKAVGADRSNGRRPELEPEPVADGLLTAAQVVVQQQRLRGWRRGMLSAGLSAGERLVLLSAGGHVNRRQCRCHGNQNLIHQNSPIAMNLGPAQA